MSLDEDNPLLLDVLTTLFVSYPADPDEQILTEGNNILYFIVSSKTWQMNIINICFTSS